MYRVQENVGKTKMIIYKKVEIFEHLGKNWGYKSSCYFFFVKKQKKLLKKKNETNNYLSGQLKYTLEFWYPTSTMIIFKFIQKS